MEELEIKAYHKRHSQIRQEKAENERKRQAALKKNEKKAERWEKERREGIEIIIYQHEIRAWQDVVADFAKQSFDYNSNDWLNDHILAIREIFYKYFDFMVLPMKNLVLKLKPSYCLSLYYFLNEYVAKQFSEYFALYFGRAFNQLNHFLRNLQ